MNEANEKQRPLIEDRLGLRARVLAHERALLVGLQTQKQQRGGEDDETLKELQALCRTAGLEVLRTVIQRRDRANAATFVHKGKAEEVKTLVEASGADAVIFNDELTPTQGRNLEELLQVKVIDRSQLIMDIFAQRAQTVDSKLQVELAQLEYLLPRLRGWGEALSRLGAGIGTRGPGETKLAMERDQIRTRIHRIQQSLKEVQVKRGVKRKQRQRHEMAQVALVGYTNAGKSTLLNCLTGADVLVEDKLFATLDPVARRLQLPDQTEAIFADTVGFIRKLPKQLVPAFQSTLESVKEADLILHVLDASDPQMEFKWRAVEQVLKDVLDPHPWPPLLHAFNKMDAVSEQAMVALEHLKGQFPHTVQVSALQRNGLEELLKQIVHLLDHGKVRVTFAVPYDQGQWLDRLHRMGEVQDQRYEAGQVSLTLVLPRAELEKFSRHAAADGLSWTLQNANLSERAPV